MLNTKISMLYLLLIFSLLNVVTNLGVANPVHRQPSQAQPSANRVHGLAETQIPKVAVFFFADHYGPSVEIFRSVVAHLPADAFVYVFHLDYVFKDFLRVDDFPASRIKYVSVSTTGLNFKIGNWARDYIPDLNRTPTGLQLVATNSKFKEVLHLQNMVARELGVPLVRSSVFMEGGNLLFDEEGNLFLTVETLTRNSALTQAAIEQELKRIYQATEIIWMPQIPGEKTGHIDMYAKLIASNHVIVADSDIPAHKTALDVAAHRFSEFGVVVTRLKNAMVRGQPFYLPYVNFLTMGDQAIVPAYSVQKRGLRTADTAAVNLLTSQFGLKVTTTDSFDLTANYEGSAHCTAKFWYTKP